MPYPPNDELLKVFNQIQLLANNIKNKRARSISRICDKQIQSIIDMEVLK